MDPDDDEDSWVFLEKSLKANSNAAADAAQHNLSKNRLRHALKDVCESAQWYSLCVLSKANDPLIKDTVSLMNVRATSRSVELVRSLEELTLHFRAHWMRQQPLRLRKVSHAKMPNSTLHYRCKMTARRNKANSNIIQSQ
jgi:hypothetical protein